MGVGSRGPKAAAPFIKRGLPNNLQRHGFVDEHHGDAVADEVGAFTIFPDEQGLKIGCHLGTGEVLERALAGLGQKALEFGILRQPEGLEGFRTAEDGEELGIDRGGGAYRVGSWEAYFFFLRRGRPVRSFSVTS